MGSSKDCKMEKDINEATQRNLGTSETSRFNDADNGGGDDKIMMINLLSSQMYMHIICLIVIKLRYVLLNFCGIVEESCGDGVHVGM